MAIPLQVPALQKSNVTVINIYIYMTCDIGAGEQHYYIYTARFSPSSTIIVTAVEFISYHTIDKLSMV